MKIDQIILIKMMGMKVIILLQGVKIMNKIYLKTIIVLKLFLLLDNCEYRKILIKLGE